jgi:hypothetical protein
MDDLRQTEGLWFSFESDAEEYVAFISAEALRVHFHATGTDKRNLMEAYKKYQERIIAMARNQFRNQARRPIRLDVKDFLRDCSSPEEGTDQA